MHSFYIKLSCNSFSLLASINWQKVFSEARDCREEFFLVYLGVSSVCLCLCFLLQAAKIPRSIRGPSAKIPRLICELSKCFLFLQMFSVFCAI